MECRNARLLLEFVRPGTPELDTEEARVLQDHLHDCTECRSLAEAESRLDEHLGRAMRDVPLPEGLQATLLRRLDVERDTCYKRLAWRVTAAAAAVLLAVGLGWYALFSTKPTPDLSDFRNIADVQFQDQENRMEPWLQAACGRDTPAPPFQSSLLIAYGFGEVKGWRIPMLLYARGAAWARVYVLDDRHFNLDDLRAQRSSTGLNGVHVEVVKDNSNSHILYVVLYHGADGPEFFMTPLPGPVACVDLSFRARRASAKR